MRSAGLAGRGRAVFGMLLLTACGGGGGDGSVIPPFWSDSGLVVEDLDGDGRVDVALATTYIAGPPPHPGYVHVFLQSSPGVFAAPAQYPVAPDPWGLSAGDFDGDGRPDLVAATPATAPIAVNSINDSGAISLLRQDPARPGRFLAALQVATGGSAEDAVIGPMSGDFLADVAVADAVGVNARALLLAQDAANPGTLLAPVSIPVGSGSEDMALADVNGDGLADVVLAAGDVVAVLYQRNGGGFDPASRLSAGINPWGVAVADVDGDGRADIVVANAGYAPRGGIGGASVSVLRQTSPGSFVASQIAVADGATRAAISDLNGDGIPDIVVNSLVFQAISEPSRISVLLQSTTNRGQFALAGSYEGPMAGIFVAAGDVNGDGLNDIVVNDGPSVLLQRADAPGSFAPLRPLR
jgi:hypothetical protein